MLLKHRCIFIVIFYMLFNPISFLATDLNGRQCGFTRSCTKNRTDDALKVNPCCVPCECTDVCKEKGTCCHDKEGRNDTRNVISQECIPALYSQDVSFRTNYVQSYYVRTKCPFGFENENIRNKCENNIPRSLQEIIFVSSKDGQIIYKNKLCAQCHGESNTILWQMNALKMRQCLQLEEERNMNITSLTELILAHCPLIFRRPNNVDPKNVMCFKKDEIVQKCNETGLWNNYSSEVKSLCENTPDTGYYIDMKVFKNIYCLVCNEKTDQKPEQCLDVVERFPQRIAFEIINILRWEQQSTIEKHECRTDQIFDTNFGYCKTLQCPSLSLPINGKCVSYLDVGGSYRLIAKLVSLEILNKSEIMNEDMSDTIQTFKRKLGFERCELCNGILYINDTDERSLWEIVIQLDIRHAAGCTTNMIWSKLTSIERNTSTITLTIAKGTISFNVFWANKIDETFKQIEALFLHVCRKIWPPGRLSYCPKVPLTRMEYIAVLKNHNNVNDLLFTPNVDHINGPIFVCIDKYLAVERSAVIQLYMSVCLFAVIFLLLVMS